MSYCLVVSLGPKYKGWSDQFGHDYSEQGELFELISARSIEALFPDWIAHQTGWSRQHAVKLNEVVPPLVDLLGEEVGKIEKYGGGEDAKEAGLDLVVYRPFADGRGARPVYLTQCASGENWPEKLHSPDMGRWVKIVDFVHVPAKAFVLPFVLSSTDFASRGATVEGLLLDRYRLLSPIASEEEWLPDKLRARLGAWLDPLIQWLRDRTVA